MKSFTLVESQYKTGSGSPNEVIYLLCVIFEELFQTFEILIGWAETEPRTTTVDTRTFIVFQDNLGNMWPEKGTKLRKYDFEAFFVLV